MATVEHFEVKRLTSTLFEVHPLSQAAAQGPEPAVQPQALGSETPEACEICCENQAEVVFLPCAHGGLCQGCADTILARSGQHCPHCRGPVQKVLLIERPVRLLHGQAARARV